MLEKGDLVRSPRGFFGVVNWCDKGEVGISFIDSSHFPGANVFKEGEVILIKRGVKEFWNKAFTRKTEEELNEELGEERALRSVLPDEKERRRRKDSRIVEMLKELTEEEREEFIRMMKERGKGGN